MSVDETMLTVAWSRAVGTSRDASRLFDALLDRHREPHRRYHGVRHVAWVLHHVNALAEHEEVHDLRAVVTAAFFHDAVYQPTAADNEAASARLATRELTALADPAWPASRVRRVAALVLATAHVDGGIDDIDIDDIDGEDLGVDDIDGIDGEDLGVDAAVLLDADLAILGAEPAGYQAYVRGVRAEYAHVDAAGWHRGRGEVLRGFLARPALYRTATARAWWDARARANLTAELASLG